MSKANPDDYKVGEVVYLAVEDDVLMEVPVEESRTGGRNWLARIWREKGLPGGLGRDFANPIPSQQAGDSGERYDLPDWFKPGAAIEFGADRRQGWHRSAFERWYGVVVGVWDDRIALQEYTTARRAIRGSEAWQGGEITLAHVPTSVLIAEAERRGLLVRDIKLVKGGAA